MFYNLHLCAFISDLHLCSQRFNTDQTEKIYLKSVETVRSLLFNVKEIKLFYLNNRELVAEIKCL